jgi:alkaline phosphatase
MDTTRSWVAAAVLAGLAASAGAAPKAKSVILFVGDAGGLPTISAAAIEAGRPQQLFIQRMPWIGLMETSDASAWVTDSAAAMTAMVTGVKTQNGVLSQDDSAVEGQRDGRTLKTILEYAEEHGLSTGVVSNSPITDATPAACYAHVNDRGQTGEIMAQVFSPRSGDGVDVMIGAGRTRILEATAARGLDLDAEARRHGYELGSSLDAVSPEARRAIVLLDDGSFDLGTATGIALRMLSRNEKGYFLMVESDLHADDPALAFRRTVELDAIIERTARAVGEEDTLVLYSADHSFDLRVRAGKKGESLLARSEATKPSLRVDNGHSGEEVVVAAKGPGSDRVRGFFPNTELFRIMMAAYGWKPDADSKDAGR